MGRELAIWGFWLTAMSGTILTGGDIGPMFFGASVLRLVTGIVERRATTSTAKEQER